MRKAAICALSIALFTTVPAFAYNDNAAGYSINDRKPDLVMKSSSMYGFADKDQNFIAVDTFSAAEVEALTGFKFLRKPLIMNMINYPYCSAPS